MTDARGDHGARKVEPAVPGLLASSARAPACLRGAFSTRVLLVLSQGQQGRLGSGRKRPAAFLSPWAAVPAPVFLWRRESVPLCISVRDPDGPPPAKRATTGLAALLPQAGCSRVRQLTRGKGVLRRPSELTRGERLVACPSVFPLNGNFQRPSPWFWIKGAHPWRGWKVACDFDSPRPYVVSVYLGWAPGSRTPGRPNPQTPRSPA